VSALHSETPPESKVRQSESLGARGGCRKLFAGDLSDHRWSAKKTTALGSQIIRSGIPNCRPWSAPF